MRHVQPLRERVVLRFKTRWNRMRCSRPWIWVETLVQKTSRRAALAALDQQEEADQEEK
jgi:hypothetical protein